MIHDTRVIPLDGRPHVPSAIRKYRGDPVGRWEGNTLVVDTLNFTDKTTFRGSGGNLHLIERFTRVDQATVKYEFTVTDPTTYTRPWTAVMPLRAIDELIYEYACHEGNHGLQGILMGARFRDKAEAVK